MKFIKSNERHNLGQWTGWGMGTHKKREEKPIQTEPRMKRAGNLGDKGDALRNKTGQEPRTKGDGNPGYKGAGTQDKRGWDPRTKGVGTQDKKGQEPRRKGGGN